MLVVVGSLREFHQILPLIIGNGTGASSFDANLAGGAPAIAAW